MLRVALACLLLGLVVAVPAANAAGTTEILRDCADDGVLQGNYKPSDLRKARKNIPTDTDEYTDCRDVLARAAAEGVAASGGGGSGGGSGGSGGSSRDFADPNTPEGRQIVGETARRGAPQVMQIGGRPVVPGTAGFAANAVRNGLPTSVIIALALLGAGALAALTPYVRRHVVARFRH